MFPCMFCFVMFCMFCILYAYLCIYLCICIFACVCIYMFYVYVYLYVCIYVCSSVHIYASLVSVGTHFCLYRSYVFNCLCCWYLGYCLSVWHCYLGSILIFSFKILNLNTTTCTKSSTQVRKINRGNMNSLFPTLIVNNYWLCVFI